MSLRRPNTSELSDVSVKIDQLYEHLMEAYSVANSDNVIVAAASKYKSEFDSQKGNWLSSNLAGISAEHTLTDNYCDSEKRNDSDFIFQQLHPFALKALVDLASLVQNKLMP